MDDFMHNVLRCILKRYTNKIRILQEFNPQDTQQRIDVAIFIPYKIDNDEVDT